jgi:hypothetical protein
LVDLSPPTIEEVGGGAELQRLEEGRRRKPEVEAEAGGELEEEEVEAKGQVEAGTRERLWR